MLLLFRCGTAFMIRQTATTHILNLHVAPQNQDGNIQCFPPDFVRFCSSETFFFSNTIYTIAEYLMIIHKGTPIRILLNTDHKVKESFSII